MTDRDITYWRVQTAQLQQLLDEAKDDPILKPQLQDRLDNALSELGAAIKNPISKGKIAVAELTFKLEKCLLQKENRKELMELFSMMTNEACLYQVRNAVIERIACVILGEQ